MSKKPKSKNIVKVNYTVSTDLDSKEVEERLSHAFDILFEATTIKLKEDKKSNPA